MKTWKMLLAGVSIWVGVETRDSLTLLSDVRGCYSFNLGLSARTVWLLGVVVVLLPLEASDELLEAAGDPTTGSVAATELDEHDYEI